MFKDGVQLNVGFRNDKISHIWAALPFLGASPNFRIYTKNEKIDPSNGVNSPPECLL